MKRLHPFFAAKIVAPTLFFLVGFFTVIAPSPVCSQDSPSDSGDVILFDGKTLEGWIAEGDSKIKAGPKAGQPVWSVKDETIRCDGSGFGFLRYKVREFSDFIWELDYRFDKPEPAPMPKVGNSGVGIRTRVFDPKKSWETRPSVASYEIQLLDDAGAAPGVHGTGSLYRFVAPTANAAKPSPEWNHLKISCKGPVVQIEVNGKLVLEKDQSTDPKLKDKPTKGYICLQNHSSGITFRNLRVRDLTAKSSP